MTRVQKPHTTTCHGGGLVLRPVRLVVVFTAHTHGQKAVTVMATKKKNTVGTSALNPQSAHAQNTEVGTGGGAAPGNPALATPPSPGAPAVPTGFTPPTKAQSLALLHPLAVQESHVAGVVSELTRLATQPFWQGAPGNGLPSPTAVGALLTEAADWSDESAHAKAWAAYAHAQRVARWDTALAAIDKFAGALAIYLEANPAMTEAVKATQSFLSARTAVSQRAATTRNAPRVATARATRATARATKATQTAAAETAAAAARHGDAIITPPSPTPPSGTPAPSPTPPSGTPAPPPPAGAKGGVTIT